MENLKLGDKVKVLGKNARGEIAFIGEVHFSDGVWLGIILDEAKGRHNGTVDGMRYFKCTRNHGVFVRSCQIEKEDPDGKKECPKPERIVYPNYLKSRFKLKTQKNKSCLDETGQTEKIKLKKQSTETGLDFDYKAVLEEKEEEIKKLTQEKNKLRLQLASVEDSLNDVLQRHSDSLKEIEYMKANHENSKKEIMVLKSHIKLLKMNSCNKKISSFKSICGVHDLPASSLSPNSVLDLCQDADHGDEYLKKSIDIMSTRKRMKDLEEQNKVMLQGLVELREFLQSNCESQMSSTEVLVVEDQENIEAAPRNSEDLISFDELETSRQANKNILREMTKFGKLMKRQNKEPKEPGKVKRASAKDRSTDKDPQPTAQLVVEELQDPNQVDLSFPCYGMNPSELIQKLQSCDGIGKSFFHPNLVLQQTASNYPSGVNGKEKDALQNTERCEQFDLAKNKADDDQSYAPNASLIKHSLLLEVNDSTSPSTSEPLNSADGSSKMSLNVDRPENNSGDNALIHPQKLLKRRMLYSAEIYERK